MRLNHHCISLLVFWSFQFFVRFLLTFCSYFDRILRFLENSKKFRNVRKFNAHAVWNSHFFLCFKSCDTRGYDTMRDFFLALLKRKRMPETKTTLINCTDYPCNKQGYCNRVLDFFPVNNFVHRMTEIWSSPNVSLFLLKMHVLLL